MGDAAPEIDRLAPPKIKPDERGNVAPKDHPKGTCGPDRQRQRDAWRQPLTKQKPAETGRHYRGQGKDRSR